MLASVVRNLITAAPVVAVALLLGFRPTSDPLRWLGVVGVLALFVFALSYLSTALGPLVTNPEAANGLTLVILFLPPVIETVRGLLMETPIGNSAWLAVAWCVAIAAVGYRAATTLYRRRTAR